MRRRFSAVLHQAISQTNLRRAQTSRSDPLEILGILTFHYLKVRLGNEHLIIGLLASGIKQ
jgi:hypothetical protein